jgi:hypothetical protein
MGHEVYDPLIRSELAKVPCAVYGMKAGLGQIGRVAHVMEDCCDDERCSPAPSSLLE